MTKIDEMRKLAQPLYAFVYKYFEKIDPNALSDIRYDFVLSPAEVYELTDKVRLMLLDLFKSTSNEDDVMDLWAHKEMVMQCMVVLTNLPVMVESLEAKGLLKEAVQTRNILIDQFTDKAIEDPNVLVAIQDGTIEEKISELRKAKEIYNFKPLFERQKSLVVDPENVKFEDIPEKF